MVGNRKQLDYGSFQAPPPPVAPVHPDADANVEQEIVDNKEATGESHYRSTICDHVGGCVCVCVYLLHCA